MGLIRNDRLQTLSSAIVLFAAISAIGSQANAQMQHRAATSDFRTIDTDADARLDRRELAAAAGRDFDRLDVDRDRYLTRDEVRRTHGATLLLPLPGRLSTRNAFAAADTDRDRKIDKREYVATIVRAYMRCDGNRDGTIEVSDLRHCRL